MALNNSKIGLWFALFLIPSASDQLDFFYPYYIILCNRVKVASIIGLAILLKRKIGGGAKRAVSRKRNWKSAHNVTSFHVKNLNLG